MQYWVQLAQILTPLAVVVGSALSAWAIIKTNKTNIEEEGRKGLRMLQLLLIKDIIKYTDDIHTYIANLQLTKDWSSKFNLANNTKNVELATAVRILYVESEVYFQTNACFMKALKDFLVYYFTLGEFILEASPAERKVFDLTNDSPRYIEFKSLLDNIVLETKNLLAQVTKT